jgi:DNA polymerase III sliding clamp (beta) subunit (PCNA family)
MAANVHYLIDGIKGISGDTLSIKTNTATTPVVFTSATDADSLYLVMPVQVR